ncbi:MAG: Hpt domain-containing protein [Chloroflexi bacterium]|nr:Hpt domain-containing protein [Chloroflexota bacterium]
MGKIIVRVDEDLDDLIPGFLDNRHKDVETMKDAIASGDYETICVLGHSMKGSGGSYGFDAITDIGTLLETAAKDEDSLELQRWVNELSVYLGRVEVVYEQ